MELTGEARLTVIEGEDVVTGLRKREEETYFGQYAKAAQARMARARARAACGRKGEGPAAGWAERSGGPAGRWADWSKSEGKILFRIKIGILNLPRLWKFVEGDLGGILI
jgi:hypothetical protein